MTDRKFPYWADDKPSQVTVQNTVIIGQEAGGNFSSHSPTSPPPHLPTFSSKQITIVIFATAAIGIVSVIPKFAQLAIGTLIGGGATYALVSRKQLLSSDFSEALERYAKEEKTDNPSVHQAIELLRLHNQKIKAK